MGRMNRLGRQTCWLVFQIAIMAAVVNWASSPDMQQSGGDNPYAVGVFALILAAAGTAAVMIVRDSALWLWRRLRPRSEPHEAYDGPRRIDAGRRLSQSRELPAGGGVRKQIR